MIRDYIVMKTNKQSIYLLTQIVIETLNKLLHDSIQTKYGYNTLVSSTTTTYELYIVNTTEIIHVSTQILVKTSHQIKYKTMMYYNQVYITNTNKIIDLYTNIIVKALNQLCVI